MIILILSKVERGFINVTLIRLISDYCVILTHFPWNFPQPTYLYWVLLGRQVDVAAGDVAGVVVGAVPASRAALLTLSPVWVPAQVYAVLQTEVEPHLGGGGLEAGGEIETLLLLLLKEDKFQKSNSST